MILTYIDGVALAADPGNPVALKNLGAIFGKEGDCPRALYYQATLQRVRSPGPVDRVRPRLRPLNRRHAAGPEAFSKGAGEGGTRGTAQFGLRWAAKDCRARAEGQGEGDEGAGDAGVAYERIESIDWVRPFCFQHKRLCSCINLLTNQQSEEKFGQDIYYVNFQLLPIYFYEEIANVYMR